MSTSPLIGRQEECSLITKWLSLPTPATTGDKRGAEPSLPCHPLLLVGTPGSGKTMLVRQIIRDYLGVNPASLSTRASRSPLYSSLSVVWINCASDTLAVLPRLSPQVLHVFDEVDQLDTKHMQQLFTTAAPSICISNTLDLHVATSPASVSPTTVPCTPYTRSHIQEALLSLLAAAHPLSPDITRSLTPALSLIGAKVSTVAKGDFRYALSILRDALARAQAANGAERRAREEETTLPADLAKGTTVEVSRGGQVDNGGQSLTSVATLDALRQLTVAHVQAALAASSLGSEQARERKALASLSSLDLFVLAVCLIREQQGTATATAPHRGAAARRGRPRTRGRPSAARATSAGSPSSMASLHATVRSLSSTLNLPPSLSLSLDELGTTVEMLESMGMVQTGGGGDIRVRVRTEWLREEVRKNPMIREVESRIKQ